ncbi:MAG: peptidoglycan-binding protein [Defluviicoccus sp.]|nr:peptidoglycan-binding protein [Defluviicoccus sp.]MDE0274246.1 peptidoglycan-binding protein [Defluviicoccus sp.]
MPDDAGAAAREVGARLREARLALGLEPGDFARELRVREALLLAIEEGRLDGLPGASYRTRLVRSCADRLGLDGAVLAAQLRPAPVAAGRRGRLLRRGGWRHPGGRVPAPAARLAALATVLSSAGWPPLSSRRVVALGAMLAAAAVGGWYLSTGGDAVPGGEEGRGARGPALAPPPEAGAIPPAGTVTPAPAAADDAARPPPGPPGPERIRAVQRALARLGYRPGPVDGLMGRRTRAAIRAYQAAAGLTEDGRLTPALERPRVAPPRAAG